MLGTQERILAIVVEILETQGYEAEKLVRRGVDAVGPAMLAALADVGEGFIADLDVIISNLVYGLSARFAAGEIAITDILPGLDRAVYWITSGYEMTSGS